MFNIKQRKIIPVLIVSVKSKRGAEINTLYLDSPASQWELQQDLGVLAHQAFPLELR